MAVPVRHMPIGELLHRVQKALRINQKELAELIGVSSRTIIRYYQRGGTLIPTQYGRLAEACQPHDPTLAAYLAAYAGMTFEQRIQRPTVVLSPHAPAPSSQAGAAPAPPSEPAARASPAHLADSVVCAAAEAMQVSPHAMRPALVAGIERMFAVGMSAGDLLQAMKAARALAPDASAKPGKLDGK